MMMKKKKKKNRKRKRTWDQDPSPHASPSLSLSPRASPSPSPSPSPHVNPSSKKKQKNSTKNQKNSTKNQKNSTKKKKNSTKNQKKKKKKKKKKNNNNNNTNSTKMKKNPNQKQKVDLAMSSEIHERNAAVASGTISTLLESEATEAIETIEATLCSSSSLPPPSSSGVYSHSEGSHMSLAAAAKGKPMHIVVGSLNPTKIQAVRMTMDKCFPIGRSSVSKQSDASVAECVIVVKPSPSTRDTNSGKGAQCSRKSAHRLTECTLDPEVTEHLIEGFDVKSGVRNQPMNAIESIDGASTRARNAMKASGGKADFAVGIEGGIEKLGIHWFESGWVVVLSRDGRVGIGSSARFLVANHIIRHLELGKELGDVMDEMTGLSDVKKSDGMMGIVTNGHLKRAQAYSHGVLFAFARFLSDDRYWDSAEYSEQCNRMWGDMSISSANIPKPVQLHRNVRKSFNEDPKFIHLRLSNRWGEHEIANHGKMAWCILCSNHRSNSYCSVCGVSLCVKLRTESLRERNTVCWNHWHSVAHLEDLHRRRIAPKPGATAERTENSTV